MNNNDLETLLQKMNNKEKLAQLTQVTPVCFGHDVIATLTGPDFGLRVPENLQCSIGSVLNCDNAKAMIEIQKKHLQNDPHKIPLLFMADVIHGFKTIFPIPLALGCSFSTNNMELSSSIAAKEASISGIHVTFSPMADLVRDPRWGRVMESTGEDPYLNKLMSSSAVRGYQGSDPAEKYKLISCVKHFAAYGIPEGGREYNTVDLSYGTLQDMFLPSYKSALDVGAKMVMSSFNTVDRIPATANKSLIDGVLRREWGFEGVVISDFNSVGEVINHSVAYDGIEASKKSLEAGVDIEMMSTHYIDNISNLIDEGLFSQELLDNSVRRVLKLKNDIGLFENPYKDVSIEDEIDLHLSSSHKDIALKIAHECAVLLKNDDILPLSKKSKIGLVGPFACTKKVLGGWSAGNTEGISLYEGLLKKYPKENIVLSITDELGSLFDAITDISSFDDSFIDNLKDCDTVIVALGENQQDTGEGASKTNLRLSNNQELLVEKLKKAGKKVVTLIFSGRPLELTPILPYTDALLQAWFLGTCSGLALADLLVGDVNPSGKLSMSFPVTVGQIPVYYNRYNTGRPSKDNIKERYVSRYLDCQVEPLFPFGFGLNYSNFKLSNLIISTENALLVSIDIENDSKIEGTEVLQLYIKDVNAKIVRPIKELKEFKRIFLKAKEKTKITFELTKEKLSYFYEDNFIFEEGYFEIMVGNSSNNTLNQKIYITENTFKHKE
ncbi:MAG: glycoside hydrolase family 3 N-terminal domain-containing protein [Lachnospirales bacterium]